MRLFVAIELPPNIEEELKRLQAALPKEGLKPVRDFHLTLKFLGDVDEDRAVLVRKSLQTISFKSMSLSLSACGAFPDIDQPRVIWTGIGGNGIEALISLQKAIDDELAPLGFDRDRSFHPHLTLARVNSIKDKQALKNCIESLNPKEIGFIADSFRLIKSTLTPMGPIYETIEVFRQG